MLRLMLPSALLLLASLPVAAATALPAVPREQPALHALADAPSQVELRMTITRLIGFGTRHTLSDTTSDSRGIGAARRWVKSRFEAISKDCGGCIEVVTPAQVFTGKRAPTPTQVMDVVAIKRGSTDPQRVIVITGHLDSRVSDVMDSTSDAPGANDDASGVAALIEAARLLSTWDNRATLVFAALSGEEQGLYGGKVLADYAVAHGWQIEAELNNDIVGNSHGQNGVVGNTTVRVFSEGTKTNETPAQADYRRYHGGEVDSPSRNLARTIDRLADQYLPDFDVRMIYRTDRFGRGGDQVPFLQAGYVAVRLPGGAGHRGARELHPPASGPAPRGRHRLRRQHRRHRLPLPGSGYHRLDNTRTDGQVAAELEARLQPIQQASHSETAPMPRPTAAHAAGTRRTAPPAWPAAGRSVHSSCDCAASRRRSRRTGRYRSPPRHRTAGSATAAASVCSDSAGGRSRLSLSMRVASVRPASRDGSGNAIDPESCPPRARCRETRGWRRTAVAVAHPSPFIRSRGFRMTAARWRQIHLIGLAGDRRHRVAGGLRHDLGGERRARNLDRRFRQPRT
ncbi:hypothetical protein RLIN73S_00731 [Rhodanobacter lindaniclasticus]